MRSPKRNRTAREAAAATQGRRREAEKPTAGAEGAAAAPMRQEQWLQLSILLHEVFSHSR